MMIQMNLDENKYILLPGVHIPQSVYFSIFVNLLNDTRTQDQLVISSWERLTGPHKDGRSIDISRVRANNKDYLVIDMTEEQFMSYYEQYIDDLIKHPEINVSQILTPFTIYDLRIPDCVANKEVLEWSDWRVPAYLKKLRSTHLDHIHITLRRV